MIPWFRNGKSILLCRRQLRLISVLLKFERQFSGQLRIAGTNYQPSEAALIRGAGTASRRADGRSEALFVSLTHPQVRETPVWGGLGCFYGDGSASFYFLCMVRVHTCVVCGCACVHTCVGAMEEHVSNYIPLSE